jgi:FkbM family methyltransferase
LVGRTGRVYAFEPDPVSFKILDQNVRLNGLKNVILEQKAASSEKGSIELYLAGTNKGDHRIYQTEENRPFVEVDAITLDEYFQNYDGRIDFVKIDTQGAEVLILKGMERLLGSNADIRMAIEFWPYGYCELGGSGEECLDILQSHDFLFFDIDRSDQPSNLYPVEKAELLTKYTIENKLFTNLFLAKGLAEFKRLDQIIREKAKAMDVDTVDMQKARKEYVQAEKTLEDFIKKILNRNLSN